MKHKAWAEDLEQTPWGPGESVGGWEKLPPARLREMRLVFMAGAEHVFMSVMNMLDEDREPTQRDLARMDALHNEIMAARRELELLMQRPEGDA